jgi:thymidine phosphorylase
MHAKPGDRVVQGEPLLTLLSDDEDRFARASEALSGGFDISETAGPATSNRVVLDRVEA